MKCVRLNLSCSSISNGIRDVYYYSILESLADWAKNWEGWKEEKTNRVETNENDMFEF